MRVGYIDGLRGIFAVSVCVTHMFYVLLPIGGLPDTERSIPLQRTLENLIGGLPFFRENSYYAVCGFFVLSAIVLSFRFWANPDRKIMASSAFRRYFRLTGPALFSVLFAYALLRCGWMRTHEIAALVQAFPYVDNMYQFPISFFGAVKSGIWDIYFSYNHQDSYNFVLWTMETELKGSFLAFAFLAIFGDVKRRFILYLPLLVIFLKTYYLAFILGLILSDITFSNEGRNIRQWLLKCRGLTAITFAVGVLLISYYQGSPSSIISSLQFAFFSNLQMDEQRFYHILGAALLVFSVLYSTWLQKLLQQEKLACFGREYSFALFLVHVPIICSAEAAVLLHFLRRGYDYGISWGISVISVLPLIALLTWFVHRYVDKPFDSFARWLEHRFML